MQVHTYRYREDDGWLPELPQSPDVDLVVCFGSPRMKDDGGPFVDMAAAFPRAVATGCSSAGEILGMEVLDDSICVATVEFDTARVGYAASPITAETSHSAGLSLGSRLSSQPDLRGVLLLSDGLNVNGSDLVRGITEGLPSGTIVTGGLAADGDRFESTWVLVDGKPAAGHAVAIGLYGDSVRIGHGSKGGWDIFGPERVVTRSENNILFELDGRPALDLYKEYLGELADGLPATGLLFPLSLRAPGEDKTLVRTILAVDDTTKSLTFAGDVPEGHQAQLMQANFDRLVDGAEEAASNALTRGSLEAELSIAISCVGRRLVLGERTEDELEATTFVLPEGIAQIGFYSYGEISPYAEGTCDLHNQTMTLTTIGEV